MDYQEIINWIIEQYDVPKKINNEIIRDMLKEPGSISSIWGFCSRNLSDCDLTGTTPDMLFNIPFNTATVWGDSCKNYDRKRIFEESRNPGLGVEALHRKGLNGDGVNIAIVDKPILRNHAEIKNNLKEYQFVINIEQNENMHFHGMTCASFLCGKTTGVAPNASLYYYAYPDYFHNDIEFWNYYFDAFDKIIEHNETSDQKINIVSLSAGISNNQPELKSRFEDYAKRLEKQRCYLIDSILFGQTFTSSSKVYNMEPDNPDCYILDQWQNNDWHRKKILVPAGGRTSACCSGEHNYMYNGNQSCFSWAIPYLCGVFALAMQISHDIDFADFCKIAERTASVNREGLKVINPVGITDYLTKTKS